MTRIYLSLGALALIGALIGAHWFTTRPALDPELAEAFEFAANVYAYSQEDVTVTEISGRRLRIEGTYHNNTRAGSFSSIATTTIAIPDDGEHVFSLANISIGDDVYTRVATESELLRGQIAFDSAWHRFRRDAIPPEFQNVAISGPILDHLALFAGGGRYLDLVAGPIDAASSTMRLYAFRLIPGSNPNPGGTLATLMDRIGDGTVSVWIDAEKRIRQIAIVEDTFQSTTTLSGFNEPFHVVRPEIVE